MDLNTVANIFSHWPTDWIIIGALVAFIALDALRSGSARAASLVLALPATVLLTNALPQAVVVGPLSAQFTAPAAQLIIFAAIFVLLYIACHRIIFTFSEDGGVLQALITGVSATVVLVVILLQVPGLQSLWHFGDQVQLVFGEAYRFWWLLAAYGGLAFVRS
ncbi:hypothetical protein A3H16_00350 [Candidatus Kaiserbacteria bacterium RIFCSPLOWO2_12_FULL_53_8]|uniref:CvpA family protein n=2 Tax=Candidatus Kaiseribacteriota TaxID=1752734 RepID=A0A1F6CXI7_9BACT|nr:MAG: hypothetical protein A2851_03210 [Candidatus Kaiserbacteria bacterium RIFCSPHIGHO2_01_FULL_53_29]OGG91431.1 MAG: hypothetical protein A3H16_00350 [Candidatus Kaiserbacteria bacterium RIFCSPLOWO2_12_FULL_53_8]